MIIGSLFLKEIFQGLLNCTMTLIRAKQRVTISSVHDAEKTTIVMTKIKDNIVWAGETDMKQNPISYVFGKWFIGYISTISIEQHGNRPDIGYEIKLYSWIPFDVSSRQTFLSKDNEDNAEEKKPTRRTVTSLINRYCFKDSKLEEVDILIPNEATESQQRIINDIIAFAHYSYHAGERRGCTTLISGPPGCGKSAIACLLAEQLGGYLARYKPNEHGTWLTNFLKIRDGKPLVLLCDEIDEMIVSCYTHKIGDHKWMKCHCHDKSSLNSHFDELRTIDDVYFIGTMNSTKEELIDRLRGDSSTLRMKRVDNYFTLYEIIE